MGKHAVIGGDLGNYAFKTQRTEFCSSFSSSPIENKLSEENLQYDGTYYLITKDRNNQQFDKTENDYALIMSLFAIGKEIIAQITEVYGNLTRAEMQKVISQYDEIGLGLGLPAGHFSTLSEKTKEYFKKKFENGISFKYNGYSFNLKIAPGGIGIYPQDYTAVAFNPVCETAKKFKTYYIIGIGGGTVDIIPIEDGQIQGEKCSSLDLGTTVMYSQIATAIQHDTGRLMDYDVIEAVLLGEPTVVDETRQNRIKEVYEQYIINLIKELSHKGLSLSDHPCVFVGGGGLLMRPVLEESKEFVKTEFIEDTHANAKFFAEFTKSFLGW